MTITMLLDETICPECKAPQKPQIGVLPNHSANCLEIHIYCSNPDCESDGGMSLLIKDILLSAGLLAPMITHPERE